MSRRRAEGLWLFLAAWVVFSAHFATNVVREHYPAFSLAERGNLQVDAYEGLHSDLFRHRDGHVYANNNVTTSVFAALPLFVFRPVLDALEEHRLAQRTEGGTETEETHYETEYEGRARFFAEVKRRGLDLRFGAATAITTAFFMAPLSALTVVWVFALLLRAGFPKREARWLALLYAFGTPLFFRTASLSNNTFQMVATFAAFALLWPDAKERFSAARRFWAGAAAGLALAADYSGAVFLPLHFLWLVVPVWRRAGFGAACTTGLPYFLGTLPPIGFLLFTQYWMYGSPWFPGQFWMPVANFTEEGWRGFGAPRWDLFWENLVSPNWGLFAFAPFLALALVPPAWLGGHSRLPRGVRSFTLVYGLSFAIFCAANQYSRMQWNTGFRYLIVLVPMLFLCTADLLVRVPRPAAWGIGLISVLHAWVPCMYRYTARADEVLSDWGGNALAENWRRFFEHGVTLPWLNVLRQTTPDASSPLHAPWLGAALVAATWGLLLLAWRLGPARLPEEA